MTFQQVINKIGTPSEVGKLVNADTYTVLQWVRGNKRPTRRQLKTLAELCGMTQDEVMCTFKKSGGKY